MAISLSFSLLRPVTLALPYLLVFCVEAHANLGEYTTPWSVARTNKAELGLNGSTYLSKNHPNKVNLADAKTGNIFATASGRISTKPEKRWQGAAEIDLGVSIKDRDNQYIDVPEAYLGMRPHDSIQISVGRKLENWNFFDEYWALGLHQGRFRWDYFDVHQNGLTGLFLSLKSNLLQVLGFWSPIFIPDQGTPFDMSEGKCSTASAWFYCPSSSLSLFNQPTDVYYKLEIPDKLRFINKPGYAAMARLGKAHGWFLRGSYAMKPMNQIMLAYEGYLNLSTQNLPVTIHVRSYKHELMAAEFGYTAKRWALVMSGLQERPFRDVTPTTWNAQEETLARYFGPTLYTRLFGEGSGETQIDLGYLKRDGGNPPESGPFSTPTNRVFEPRHSFWEAYSISLRTPIIPAWGEHFWITNRFIMDSANKGNLLIADINVRPYARWQVNAGIDMLGSQTAEKADFISRWQRNDRVRGGIKYVF